MKKINYCTQCGCSVKDLSPDPLGNKNHIKCTSCLSVLDATTGEIISKPVIAIDYDPGDYPEGFNSELYGI